MKKCINLFVCNECLDVGCKKDKLLLNYMTGKQKQLKVGAAQQFVSCPSIINTRMSKTYINGDALFSVDSLARDKIQGHQDVILTPRNEHSAELMRRYHNFLGAATLASSPTATTSPSTKRNVVTMV